MLVRLLIAWLRRVVSPLTRWRVVMIILILFIILGLGHILIRIKPIRHTLLVKNYEIQVSVIQKKGRCVIWIIIKIEKNCCSNPFHTKWQKQTKKNKQTKERKKNLTYIRVDLRPRWLLTRLSMGGILQQSDHKLIGQIGTRSVGVIHA